MAGSRCLVRMPLLLIVLTLIGCSKGDHPDLGYVTGKVTIGGAPLAGVIVTFMPDKGRVSTGLTDSQGNYELRYTYQDKGCKLGPNSVGFFPPTGGSTSHPLPARYQDKAEFKKVEVKAGNNTFDFALDSDPAIPKKGTPVAKSGPLPD